MTGTPLTILAIDDDPGDLELLRRHLEDVAAFAITLVTCTNAEAGYRELSRHTHRCHFSRLPAWRGYGARHLAQPQRRWGPAAHHCPYRQRR